MNDQVKNKMKNNGKRVVWIVAALLFAAALLWWLLRADPVEVETARVALEAVTVAIEEDGETHAHDRYTIAAPVAGRLLRIELHEGDSVRAGQQLAQLAPLPLAAAEREQTLARLTAAQSLAAEATQRAARAGAELEQARRERRRVEQLVGQKFVSDQALEQARLTEAGQERELAAAQARARAAASDIEAVRAVLTPERRSAPLIALRSPVDGKVLRIAEKSERAVQAGVHVIVVGDPSKLEAVVDVLSTDAVRIQPGMRVQLFNWGGPPIDNARVRTVEPAAFTKLSALGVEEQRVNVVIDLPALSSGSAQLGDAYRVDARIIVAEKNKALSVPTAALFRQGEGWAVFVLQEGRVQLRPVQLGLRGAKFAEVMQGLAEGETVVLYPGNQLADGMRAKSRQ